MLLPQCDILLSSVGRGTSDRTDLTLEHSDTVGQLSLVSWTCNKEQFLSSKKMDNAAFLLSEDTAVLSEGAGRKVIPFSRFLSKSEGEVDDKFKIQKKVSTNIL